MISKFRAWDKEEKEWLSIRTIGFDDDDGSLWYLQAWDDNENDIDPPYFEDDLGVKWELLQSTGLKDKNGVEIFEGDILKIKDSRLSVYVVEWHKDKFMWVLRYQKDKNQYFPFYNVTGAFFEEIEVIGNIWEDGEILDDK